jgi:hypothetical protein
VYEVIGRKNINNNVHGAEFILEKMIVAQQVKEFPAFYEIRRFIAMFMVVR